MIVSRVVRGKQIIGRLPFGFDGEKLFWIGMAEKYIVHQLVLEPEWVVGHN
jgi:hypothetical protein